MPRRPFDKPGGGDSLLGAVKLLMDGPQVLQGIQEATSKLDEMVGKSPYPLEGQAAAYHADIPMTPEGVGPIGSLDTNGGIIQKIGDLPPYGGPSAINQPYDPLQGMNPGPLNPMDYPALMEPTPPITAPEPPKPSLLDQIMGTGEKVNQVISNLPLIGLLKGLREVNEARRTKAPWRSKYAHERGLAQDQFLVDQILADQKARDARTLQTQKDTATAEQKKLDREAEAKEGKLDREAGLKETEITAGSRERAAEIRGNALLDKANIDAATKKAIAGDAKAVQILGWYTNPDTDPEQLGILADAFEQRTGLKITDVVTGETEGWFGKKKQTTRKGLQSKEESLESIFGE